MFNLPDFKVLTDLFGLPQTIVDFASSVVNGFFDITWKSGVQIILLLVAVNHISPSYYEVADMEGATGWEKLWKVTIPMIAPTILVVIIYTIIDSFTDYGNSIMRLIDEYRKQDSNYEYATAIGLVYFLIVGLLIAIVTLLMRKVTKNAEY
jgi:ABC-type sugar transport system permease subunit